MDLFLKLKKVILEKRLIKTFKKKTYPYLKGFLLFFKFEKNNIKIYTSKLKKIDTKDLPLANRIFKSYKLTKSEQDTKSTVYKPSSLWQSQIDNDFSFLQEAYKNDDVEKFLFFLQNFGNWEKYLGVENQDLIKKYNKNIFLKKFLSNEIFEGQLKLWKYFNADEDLDDLNIPKHGNQIGAVIDNKFMVIGSFSNHIYSKILLNYLNLKSEKNKIVELGGGYGKLAYYLLKNVNNYTYIDLDIPETLTLASYFLSKSFPNKKNLFYGERSFNNNISNEYDLIFLPPWEIETIQDNSVNLAINKNSLGEMNPETARNYINHIHRTSKYFFSMNHEYFRNYFNDGKKSLINKEYNIDKKFMELIRYPDLGHLTYERNKLDFDNNIFFYIYEKNKN
jgi:putative sugar O-methyltransferase